MEIISKPYLSASLGIAAEAAREGDFTKCALYVENIADVFFPVDGGDDPVWPNAANNAFKRAAYGLIDYYLEEEKELRERAERTGMNPQVLETKIDAMWGKVTLYNCYQLFVQLTAKKLKSPRSLFQKMCEKNQARLMEVSALLGDEVINDGLDEKGEPKQEGRIGPFSVMENGNPDPSVSASDRIKLREEQEELLYWFSDEGQVEAIKKADRQHELLWEDKPEADLLTLFFNATAALPRNSMRTLINNANNALRAMAGAEKMLASVYGIAITAMVRAESCGKMAA